MLIKGVYIIDNGSYLYLCVFNEVDKVFLNNAFNIDSLAELKIDNHVQSNSNIINTKIINIIDQLRVDNRGFIQPLKILINELTKCFKLVKKIV